jgi:hypothetical protein
LKRAPSKIVNRKPKRTTIVRVNGHLPQETNSDGSNADPNQPSELVEFSATGRIARSSGLTQVEP